MADKKLTAEEALPPCKSMTASGDILLIFFMNLRYSAALLNTLLP